MNSDLQLIDAGTTPPTYYDTTAKRHCFVSPRGDKRFHFNTNGAAFYRVVARWQALTGRSMPKATKPRIDEFGTLLLTSRHGVEFILHPETPEAWIALVKDIHRDNDQKEGLR